MNTTSSTLILSVFDVIIAVLGIYLITSAVKMKKTKEIGTVILTPEEIGRCKRKEELAEFLCWREMVLGVVFLLFGFIRLLDTYVLKIGGVLDILLMIVLIIAVLWFFKSLQTARAEFLS